jgi:magnesium chelatase subunit I
MPENITTLADLIKSGYCSKTARDCLFEIIKKKIKAGEELFPDIFGLQSEKRRFIETLISGKGALLTGEYGVAKTDLAKHVQGLLNEYHEKYEVYYVTQCPVQEDPLILAQVLSLLPAGSLSYRVEPCPICKAHIRDVNGNPDKIAVRRLDRIVEGKGFARVQGGGDVLPEEIVGTYNLLKLAQIGDPFDPRVFEPGKIGQSSRGLLFVDEIGKLSESAQHALIQAAQENCVTPTKSRETFPVDFLLVATTNYADEEFICGAVRDRLVSLKIPLVGIEDEIRIVHKEINRIEPKVYIPHLFIKLAIEVIRALRSDERLELGPRTSINAGLIARSSALLEGRNLANYCDIKEGIYTAVLGKALFEDKHDIENKIDELFPAIASYLDKNMTLVLFSKIISEYRQEWGIDAEWSSNKIEGLMRGTSVSKSWDHMHKWTREHEPAGNEFIPQIIALYLSAYEKGCDKNG